MFPYRGGVDAELHVHLIESVLDECDSRFDRVDCDCQFHGDREHASEHGEDRKDISDGDSAIDHVVVCVKL